MTRVALRRTTWDSPFALSPAEMRVMVLLVNGYTNREIARLLCVTEQTVKLAATAIYRQMGVRNRVEAAVCWVREIERPMSAAS